MQWQACTHQMADRVLAKIRREITDAQTVTGSRSAVDCNRPHVSCRFSGVPRGQLFAPCGIEFEIVRSQRRNHLHPARPAGAALFAQRVGFVPRFVPRADFEQRAHQLLARQRDRRHGADGMAKMIQCFGVAPRVTQQIGEVVVGGAVLGLEGQRALEFSDTGLGAVLFEQHQREIDGDGGIARKKPHRFAQHLCSGTQIPLLTASQGAAVQLRRPRLQKRAQQFQQHGAPLRQAFAAAPRAVSTRGSDGG